MKGGDRPGRALLRRIARATLGGRGTTGGLATLGALAAVACGGSDTPPSVAASGPFPAGSVVLPGAVAPTGAAAALAGRYHLDAADALNLVLEPDGTFRWHIDGCDFEGSGCGLWKGDGEVARLEPLPGTRLDWIDDVGLATVDGALVARPGGDGGIVVVGIADERPLEQQWRSGGVCPRCGGTGPTDVVPCETPVPACRPRTP